MQDPGLQFMANGVSSGSTPLEALTRADDGTPGVSPEDQAAASSGSFKLPSWILTNILIISYILYIYESEVSYRP
jgi:hypothetical protein